MHHDNFKITHIYLNLMIKYSLFKNSFGQSPFLGLPIVISTIFFSTDGLLPFGQPLTKRRGYKDDTAPLHKVFLLPHHRELRSWWLDALSNTAEFPCILPSSQQIQSRNTKVLQDAKSKLPFPLLDKIKYYIIYQEDLFCSCSRCRCKHINNLTTPPLLILSKSSCVIISTFKKATVPCSSNEVQNTETICV